jgi:tetratricopeptide (TPR) repeat protein
LRFILQHSLQTKSAITVVIRIASSLAAILICFFLIFVSLRFGISRAVGRAGVSGHNMPFANEATRLTPSDPDAHRAKANVFRELRMYPNAKDELEVAVSLRPRDDFLWLELGMLRDELNDQVGALNAFDQAVALAPYYAHTRWQRSNLRLRLGRYDEAFPELRAAAQSNRVYLPALIDLAWSLSKQDAKLTQELAGIDSVDSRTAFARLLARNGKGSETLEQSQFIKSAVSPAIKRELISSLMATFNYREAFQIWSDGAAVTSQIYDGGFEGTLNFGETGFGWTIGRGTLVKVSQDAGEKETAERSLRITFGGDSPATLPIISQTIVVRPEQKYRVTLAVKAKDVVTGGAPILVIEAARSRTRLAVANLQLEQGMWHKLSVEFTVPIDCGAVLLKVVRNECETAPCPIFGTLWLDSFGIQEIGS